MQLFKLGALTALGALLALPVMAQGSYQGTPSRSGSYSGFNQAMNNPESYQGSYNTSRPGHYAGGFNTLGMYANQGGYAQGGTIPHAGNPPSDNFGPDMYGGNMPMHMMNMPMHMRQMHHRMAREVHNLRQALQQAGFTNVRVVPRSFLVRAEDQEGHQVLMIVSPHSIQEMMAFTPGQSGHAMGHQRMNQGRMAGNYGQTGSGWASGNQ